MRRALCWIGCHALYWIGHGVSRVMNGPQAYVLYPIYNRCMVWSCSISDAGDIGLWLHASSNQSEGE